MVIGDGPQRTHLVSLRTALCLENYFESTGWLSPLDVAARLAGADLFVLPPRRETVDCLYLEATAVGVPTIVSRRAGTAAIPSDVEAYENAAELGRKPAQRYTWDAHAQRLRDVLEKGRPAAARRHLL